jgi:peptidoglycan-associated lipoprotein
MRSRLLAQTLILIIAANCMTGCAVKRWWNYHFGPRTSQPPGVSNLPGGTDIAGGTRPIISEGDMKHGEFASVYFDYDSAKVRPSEDSKLEIVAAALKGNSKKLVIEGHCDERGTAEYNRALGERRAQAAREELVRMGVDAGRISTISYGKDRPADTGHDEAAWAKNRRCEFVVVSQ